MTARGFAERLIDHAAAVMPERRREWAAAMQAEFTALPVGRVRLAWAVGCVWASYCERIQPMDVFVKSLVRAAAALSVVFAFFAVMVVLHSKHPFEAMRFLRLMSMFYGGIFATLWVCELLIARYWTAPNKIFKKTLLRATVLWLWPLGLGVYQITRVLTDPVIRARLGDPILPWLQHWLVNWVRTYPLLFVAIFVPLFLCELVIARFWRAKATTPA
jgi:hypothetical protein